jgi:hypothetical protein
LDIKLDAGRKRKRTESIALVAQSMELEFSDSDIFNIPKHYDGYPYIGEGYNRCSFNVIYGKHRGYEIKAFDHEYYFNDTTVNYRKFSTVVIDTGCCFSTLLVRPEGVCYKYAGALGFINDDINFESDEFNRSFYVNSEDKKFAYDVLHPRMMNFLLANKEWCFQMVQGSIILCLERVFTPEEFRNGINFLYNLVEHLPEHLQRGIQQRSA